MNRIIKYLLGWRESWLLSYRPFKLELERYGYIRLLAAGIVIGFWVVAIFCGDSLWGLISG